MDSLVTPGRFNEISSDRQFHELVEAARRGDYVSPRCENGLITQMGVMTPQEAAEMRQFGGVSVPASDFLTLTVGCSQGVTEKKAAALIEYGMVITGYVLTNPTNGDRCSVDRGRVNWAGVRTNNAKAEQNETGCAASDVEKLHRRIVEMDAEIEALNHQLQEETKKAEERGYLAGKRYEKGRISELLGLAS